MFAARVMSSRSGSKLYMYETAVRRTSIGGACSGIERRNRRTDGRTSEGNPEDRIRHHPDQEKGEVDSRELVTGPGGLGAGMRDELRGEREEGDAQDDGDDEVDGVEY